MSKLNKHLFYIDPQRNKTKMIERSFFLSLLTNESVSLYNYSFSSIDSNCEVEKKTHVCMSIQRCR